MTQPKAIVFATSPFAGIAVIKHRSMDSDDNSSLSSKKSTKIDRKTVAVGGIQEISIRDSITSPHNSIIEPKILTFQTTTTTQTLLLTKRKASVPVKNILKCLKCGKLGHLADDCRTKRKKKTTVRRLAKANNKSQRNNQLATPLRQPTIDVSKCIYFIFDLETTGFSKERN